MDFMQDTLANGRRFRTLNVLDTVTRECLRIEVDTSLPGKRVVRALDQLVERHGTPKQITLDNGPEFTGQALDAWAYAHGVQLDFIDPGKPMQNGYQESFNGKFRDECLNLHWFLNLDDARRIIGEMGGGVQYDATAQRVGESATGGVCSHRLACGSLTESLVTLRVAGQNNCSTLAKVVDTWTDMSYFL